MSVPERFLITGGGGFVGRNVALALLVAGRQVTLVDRLFDARLRADLLRRYPDQLQWVEADAGALPDFTAEVLIHAAAITAGPDERGETVEANLRANLEPGLAALEWAARQKVSRVILVSSSGIYSQSALGGIDETLPPLPVGPYALAKHLFEQLAATLRIQYQRDVVAVRLGDIYGPGELPRPSRPRVSLIGKLIGEALVTGKMRVPVNRPARDWTFAPDLGRAMLALADAPTVQHSLYNLTSAQTLTPIEAAYAVQSIIPSVQIVLDEIPLGAPKRLGHLSNDRFSGEFCFRGWTSLSDGIAQTVQWLRATVESVQ